MRCRTCQPLPEEVARAAELLGRRWVLAILWASSEEGSSVKLKLVAVGSTAALALCGTGAAAAGNPGQTQPQSVKVHIATLAQGSRVDAGAVFDAAVAYLQIDKQTLFRNLKNGQ